jgi:hypothetical protein
MNQHNPPNLLGNCEIHTRCPSKIEFSVALPRTNEACRRYAKSIFREQTGASAARLFATGSFSNRTTSRLPRSMCASPL